AWEGAAAVEPLAGEKYDRRGQRPSRSRRSGAAGQRDESRRHQPERKPSRENEHASPQRQHEPGRIAEPSPSPAVAAGATPPDRPSRPRGEPRAPERKDARHGDRRAKGGEERSPSGL